MHLFVGVNWQCLGIPARWLWPAFVLLWASYPVARWREWHWLEYLAANWMGILFLQFAFLLVVGVINLGGYYWPSLQRYAAIAAGILAGLALIQGHRAPAIRDYEVRIPGLTRDVQLVAISDLHLGSLLGKRWAGNLITQVNALQPDLVCVVGDLIDSHVDHVEELLPTLRQLRAPLGVYAVTGNHEWYAGLDRSVALLEQAGYTVLRDRRVEVLPGLTLAGIDDITTRVTPIPELSATILLSHTPTSRPEAKLILSGHTHGGQVWPFSHLVQIRHKFMAGQYDLPGKTVIVSRGAGTWGPRMRLWQRGEILRIRLRAESGGLR